MLLQAACDGFVTGEKKEKCDIKAKRFESINFSGSVRLCLCVNVARFRFSLSKNNWAVFLFSSSFVVVVGVVLPALSIWVNAALSFYSI